MQIPHSSVENTESHPTAIDISNLPKSLRRYAATSQLNYAVLLDVNASQPGVEPQTFGTSVNGNFSDMLLALEISDACEAYRRELVARDTAKSLRNSIDDLSEIARLAERLRNVINGCDPAVINKMMAIGPISIDLGRYDRNIFEASRSDYLPITPQEMGPEPTGQPDWNQSLLYLGRLAGLVIEGVRKQAGSPEKGLDVGRGRRSVHGLSTAHPAWTLVKRLSELLGERAGHRIGTDRKDGRLLEDFVTDVLDWQFPNEFLNFHDAYVVRYLQCARAINKLNALKDQWHSALDATPTEDLRTRAKMIMELERLNRDLSAKKRLLVEGPTRRNRAKPVSR